MMRFCVVGVLLVTASRSYGCLPRCYQTNDSTCNETAAAKHEDTAETVIMTMMAPEVVSAEWQAQRDRVITTILCLKKNVNVTGYCVRETKVTNTTCSSADVATNCSPTSPTFDGSCENAKTCVCKSFYLYAYSTLTDAVLPSSTLIEALEDDGSKLALKVAGFEVVSIVTSKTDKVPWFNAPLQAWVLVGVGVIVAMIYGTKPLWWNRCLYRRSKPKEGMEEPNTQEQLTPKKSDL